MSAASSSRRSPPLSLSLALGVLGNFDILSRIGGEIRKLALVCKDILAACMKARLGMCGNLTPCTFFARGTVVNALAAAGKPLWMHEMVTRIVCEERPTEAVEYVEFLRGLRAAFPTAKTLSLNTYHEISMADFRQWTDDYTALTSLTLHNHHVGTGEDHNRDELDFTPYDNLRKYTALTSLAIYGGNIADAIGFFHSMRCMTSLVVLTVHDNNLSRMNKCIHTALPLLTRLKHLSLSDCRVMDNHPGLLHALYRMDLKTLDISGTDLCNRDAPLGRALRKNTGLESLNLAYCDMSTPVRVIRGLTSLTHLDLRNIRRLGQEPPPVARILQAVANFPFKEPRRLHLLMNDGFVGGSDDSDHHTGSDDADNGSGSAHNPLVVEDE